MSLSVNCTRREIEELRAKWKCPDLYNLQPVTDEMRKRGAVAPRCSSGACYKRVMWWEVRETSDFPWEPEDLILEAVFYCDDCKPNHIIQDEGPMEHVTVNSIA